TSRRVACARRWRWPSVPRAMTLRWILKLTSMSLVGWAPSVTRSLRRKLKQSLRSSETKSKAPSRQIRKRLQGVVMIERKLVRPETLAEALGQREQYQKDALPIAGGQSLLVLLRNKLIDPKVLIDLERISELRSVESKTDGMKIGAMN